MIKILILPGALFLAVILLRVVIPMLKSPGWKRIIDKARYERLKERPERSDQILTKAIARFPRQPEIYLEYFLNHSEKTNLQQRFQTLRRGWEMTQDPVLGFFLGNAFLEEGDYKSAEELLIREDVQDYALRKKIPVTAQLHYEKGEYDRAVQSFLKFYNLETSSGSGSFTMEDIKDLDLSASQIPPRHLVLLALILKQLKAPYTDIMALLPSRSFHSTGSWQDTLARFREEEKKVTPAHQGIYGPANSFNANRKRFYQERISLIEEYMKGAALKK